ncbi:hypothetical protein [Pseudomonas indica]|uniref:hypothetical protein n=1 Tax=Pseudomonas indica TaxID=137658 RepID=UPI000BABD45C|nr:hypothetical protein [Pseudomonas indica]PAU53832.1 hypothetical protein BZL42_22465 [Pseudomonas indica]
MLKLGIGVLFCLACTTQAVAGSWEFHTGEEDELCTAMREHLNRLTVRDLNEAPTNSCATTAVRSYPEFKMPPWQELDASKHETLIYELFRFLNLGTVAYFGRARPGALDKWTEMTKEQQEIFNQRRREQARRFIERGGHLRVWRARLVEDFGITTEIYAAPGPQTIVQLRYPDEIREAANRKVCPELSREPYAPSYLFFVTDDLSGLDSSLGYTADSLVGSEPLLLDGKVIFRAGAGGDIVTLGRDEGSGPSDFCELHYLSSEEK